MSLDFLTLHEFASIISCCEPCVKNKRCKKIILIISFTLLTFDMITDWINWAEWSKVGGYDQYYFASIFQKIFLCVAAVGTGLWIIELFVIIKKWINIYQKHLGRNASMGEKEFASVSEPQVINSDKHTPKEHVRSCDESPLELEPELGNCNDQLVELKVMNQNESPTEPNIIIHKKTPSEPKVMNYNESPSEPKVINSKESPTEPEIIHNKEAPSEAEVMNYNESPSELEVMNYNESPSEPEIRNYKESPSEPEIKNYNESPSESESEQKVINYKESVPESEITNQNKYPCKSKIISKKESGHELEVKNDDESVSRPAGRNSSQEDENEGQYYSFLGDRAVHRLGIIVLILIGFLEDLPVVIAVHYTSVIPMCGVPAKQAFGSGVTLATIISSMLNSLWTMILLLCELCKCTEKGFCFSCYVPRKEKTEKFDNLAHIQGNRPTPMLGKRKTNRKGYLKKSMKLSAKKRCFNLGKIVLCVIIFLLFSTTFGLGFLTMGYVLGFISLRFVKAGAFILHSTVFTGYLGPGLDAKPDQAMFIYLRYKLPDWHQVVLHNKSAVTMVKSASFRQVFNRFYIGQLEELSHLEDGTLTKAIPCHTVYPYMNRNDKSVFHKISDELYYENCKIIFTLRYHPTNNNWQPFTNFIHDFYQHITIEYGIHLKDAETCPIWFDFLLTETKLNEKMKQDIINYTCKSACGDDAGICNDAGARELTPTNGTDTNQISVSFRPYLVINNLKNLDYCLFDMIYHPSTKFCDKTWASIEPVEVPEEMKQAYPRFITIPITNRYGSNLENATSYDRCDKLWQSDKFIEV